jgi:hypothetical protein
MSKESKAAEAKSISVVCVAKGYYKHSIIEEGTIFDYDGPFKTHGDNKFVLPQWVKAYTPRVHVKSEADKVDVKELEGFKKEMEAKEQAKLDKQRRELEAKQKAKDNLNKII